MVMEYLERIFRSSGIPEDLSKAEALHKWLQEREDIPLPGTRVRSPHGNEGRRMWITEQRDNGAIIKVPKQLLTSELIALSYGATLRQQRPQNPFFQIKEIRDQLGDESSISKRTGMSYKIVYRLERWGYIVSRWESIDPNVQGRVIRRRFISITKEGLDRFTKETYT